MVAKTKNWHPNDAIEVIHSLWRTLGIVAARSANPAYLEAVELLGDAISELRPSGALEQIEKRDELAKETDFSL